MGVTLAGALQTGLQSRESGVVDLHCLGARELDALLAEEAAEWETELDWDFSKIGDLVRRLADERRLNGAVLLDCGEVAGCSYAGLEGDTGLIVDVYVRRRWRGRGAERLLFGVLLDALIAIPGLRRVESQLMLLAESPLPNASVRSFERLLMKRDGKAPLPPGRSSTDEGFFLRPLQESDINDAAAVVALAYAGHVDSRIRDQYRTLAGARQLLKNLMQVQVCDRFCARASFVALDRSTGAAAGLSIASFVADRVGHIGELCVVPDARGAGLAYQLLRQSMAALRSAGADRVSLTVTAANEDAVRLYARSGFTATRRFSAYAWARADARAG